MLYSQPWIYMHQLKQSKLRAAPIHSLRPTGKNSWNLEINYIRDSLKHVASGIGKCTQSLVTKLKLYLIKKAAINNLADEVKVHKNNPGSLWKISNKTIPVKEKEIQVYTKDLKSIVEDFNNYFISVGKITAAAVLDLANKNITLSDPMFNSEIYPTDQQIKFKPVTCSVIWRIIVAMPRNKSPGPDKISMGVIKDCLPMILGPLTNLINTSLVLGKFSNKWKLSEVIPLHKDGNQEILI